MNKNRHRIIFNAARGQRMAVAETGAGCGKSAGGGDLQSTCLAAVLAGAAALALPLS